MTRPTSEEHQFIRHLNRLLENKDIGRAAMANLRRGLGKAPGAVFEMDRYVLSKLPEKPVRNQEAAYYTVAALFALWHQGKDKVVSLEPEKKEEKVFSTDVNLGKSLQKLVDKQTAEGSKREDAANRLEKRLNAMLNAHRDDLPEHLRRLISLLKAKEVPVDWTQLLSDIQGWDHEDRRIQHDWAKGFWITHRKTDADNTEENQTKQGETK